MSTKSHIDLEYLQDHISPIRGSAITLSCGNRVIHKPSMNELYDMASEQFSAIVTDIPMADPHAAGLSGGRDRVLVSFTGKDVARSAWARLIAPQPVELKRNPELLDFKDRIERLARENNMLLFQQDIIHTEVYFGRNPEFMGKIHFIVPRIYAKLAFDLNLNFLRRCPESDALYQDSRPLDIPDLWLICNPDWVNPVWQAWRNRVRPADTEQIRKDPEPKRIIMLFDINFYTAYLLGAKYFGEIKKACLTMIWDSAIKHNIGMPIHGSSKTLFVQQAFGDFPTDATSASSDMPSASNQPITHGSAKTSAAAVVDPAVPPSPQNAQATADTADTADTQPALKSVSFITIGLSGSGKSTIGNDPHADYLDTEQGEYVRIGNDDALLILHQTNEPKCGTIGLENGCYNKSNDYTPDSFYIKTVQSAENVMIARDNNNKRYIIHQDILNGNGRVQTARMMLPGADASFDCPLPNYITLLMKDETLPPLMRIIDHQLIVSMYMSLATRSTSAENIPVAQMNKLKMVPGANPFNTWGLEQDAEFLEQTLIQVNSQGLVMNTGGFFIDSQHNARNVTRKIPKELSLSVYPKIAREQIIWMTWPHFPGVEIPHPDSFADVYPLFDSHFNPLNIADADLYHEFLRKRLLERQDFLLSIGIDRRFILPIRKAIIQIDENELLSRGRTSHVDNINTFINTGRDPNSID
jgi:hypothetical protein